MVNFQERHFTADELATAWNTSPDNIRRIFRDEDGVLAFTKPRRQKRIYIQLRIPESVATRVYLRLTRGGQR